jgi:hypothetical protein
VSAGQLRGLGFGKHAVSREPLLDPVHRGVYAVGHDGLTMEGRFLAGVLAVGDRAVLSHTSGAALWALTRWDGEIHVTVDRKLRRRDGIRIHCVKHLPTSEITRRAGIPVTTPARTILDLAGVLPYWRLRRALRRAEVEKRVSHPGLGLLLDAHPNARGSKKITQLLRQGPAPTGSDFEYEFLDRLEELGLERPGINARVDGSELGLGWPARSFRTSG